MLTEARQGECVLQRVVQVLAEVRIDTSLILQNNQDYIR